MTVHAYTPRAVRRAVEAGVKVVEHGQLLDEPTIRLLADKGVFLSLQALDPAPPGDPGVHRRAKLAEIVTGTDNAFRWARQHKVKLLWGTDFLFNPAQNRNQNKDLLKLRAWFTPAEVLKLATHDNAQVFALSGPRNPYPGKLGVVEEGALADLILVDGDPLAELELIAEPGRNFMVIMKDGKIHECFALSVSARRWSMAAGLLLALAASGIAATAGARAVRALAWDDLRPVLDPVEDPFAALSDEQHDALAALVRGRVLEARGFPVGDEGHRRRAEVSSGVFAPRVSMSRRCSRGAKRSSRSAPPQRRPRCRPSTGRASGSPATCCR